MKGVEAAIDEAVLTVAPAYLIPGPQALTKFQKHGAIGQKADHQKVSGL